MLEKHLIRLRHLEAALKKAVDLDDYEQIGLIDKEYSMVWDDIFSYPPESESECRELFVLLLGSLSQELDDSPENARVRARILELFDARNDG